MYFSHGSQFSKGTCILTDPSISYNVQYSFSNNLGRTVLITVNINGQKVSFCNIYAPNNSSEQLEFIQELNNCIIDKSELTNLIVGGDWNCTLTKKDKKRWSTVETNTIQAFFFNKEHFLLLLQHKNLTILTIETLTTIQVLTPYTNYSTFTYTCNY